jgi:glycosyltransferase involved in cell wall biosynthesis
VMARYWSINGRFLTQPLTGVQRYACEIVQALDALLAADHPLARMLEIELLVPKGQTNELPLRHIRTRIVTGAGGHLWEQLMLPQNVSGGLISLCNTGPIVLSKHIVCIHDLHTRLYPASYSLPFRTLYGALLPTLGRTANGVATVSRFSAGQLINYGIGSAEKVRVIPNGHEHVLRWRPRHSQKTRSAAGSNTVVLAGSLAPHKNIRLVLGMADKLAAAGLKIAVAGISDARVFNAGEASPAADNIIWLGRLSDDELAALLMDSFCLAFPSFTEGFGLPPLEAMTLGCPVIATDRASLPEICEGAALFASPTDGEAWFQQFVRLRGSESLRAQLVAKGRARAKLFSWSKSAELYLELMARADGVSPSYRREPVLSEQPQHHI